MKAKRWMGVLLAAALTLGPVPAALAADSAEPPAIVGEQVMLDGEDAFELPETGMPCRKVWVFCERGRVRAEIVNAAGQTAGGCVPQVLDSVGSAKSCIFWTHAGEGDALRLTSEAEGGSTVWFHATGAEPEDFGTAFSAGSQRKTLALCPDPEAEALLLWVCCESGSMDVRVRGNVKALNNGGQYTLISGSEDPGHLYILRRTPGAAWDLTLEARGVNGFEAGGWYYLAPVFGE